MANQKLNVGTNIVVVAVLIAIVIGALWFAASAWTEVLSSPPMPPVGDAAMIMDVVLSLLIGCGLMALLFYSSRHGYDEQHPPDKLG